MGPALQLEMMLEPLADHLLNQLTSELRLDQIQADRTRYHKMDCPRVQSALVKRATRLLSSLVAVDHGKGATRHNLGPVMMCQPV